MSQQLRTVDNGRGYRILRCEGRLYKIEREAPPAEGGTGKWRISVKDGFSGSWNEKTNSAPWDRFDKLREAVESLRGFIALHPVPQQQEKA